MSGEFNELAAAAAEVLVSALGGDSWQEARQWFAEVVGHEGRLTATHAELAEANSGLARTAVVQAQVRSWTVRLRDVFEDSPAAARTLQDLVDGMRRQGLLPTAAISDPALVLAQSQAAPVTPPLVTEPPVAPPTPPTPATLPTLTDLVSPSVQPVPAPTPGPVPAATAAFAPTVAGRSRGKVKVLIASGLAVVVVAAAVIVSWQSGLFGRANPQLRPLGWTGTEASLPGYAATSGTASNWLGGIACPTSDTCLAVGQLTPRAGSGNEALVERLSNGTWTPDAAEPPLPSDADSAGSSQLNYIVCSAPSACTAAGIYSTSAANGTAENGLVETLSGTTWAPAKVPLPPDAGQDNQVFLDGLDCPAAGSCVSTGFDFANDSQGNRTNSQPLIATQNGGTWTSAEAPLPPDAATTAQQAGLYFVSCTSQGACTAVGSYTDKAGQHQGLIDTLSDGTWAAAKAPLPKDAKGGVDLWGVSCDSGSCVAVGQYATGNSGSTTQRALIETLQNGNAKSAKPQSLLPGKDSALEAIYCVSASSCLAVGGYGSSSLQSGLAATLADGTWSTTPVPLPANVTAAAQNQSAMLWSVTCLTTANCDAVGGDATSAGGTVPLVATGTLAAATTGTAAAPAAGSAGAQPGAAGLPLGQGTFQIRGSVTEFDASKQSIALQGTVDGLALSATGTGNGLPGGGFSGQDGYCGSLGVVGSSASGTLGGVPFTVTLSGCSVNNNVLTATYAGTWGSRPVNLTLTTDDDSDVLQPTLSGTVGSQQVSAPVPDIVLASGAPGQTSQISGTITVS